MKPTKQMIENEPAGPRIDAWFCELVMGWKLWTRQSEFGDEYLCWHERGEKDYIKPGKYICVEDSFRPSTNIAHAIEGVEIANNNGLWGWIERPIFLNWHVTFAKGKGEIDDVIDYHAEAKELSLAITKALLLWAIEKDK